MCPKVLLRAESLASTVLKVCLGLKEEVGDLHAQSSADPTMCVHGSFLPGIEFCLLFIVIGFCFYILFSVDFMQSQD